MGRKADKEVLAQYGAYDDSSLAAYVERVGQKLAAVSDRPDLEWHFRLLDSPVVNAFAIPGGYIYTQIRDLEAIQIQHESDDVFGNIVDITLHGA